MVAIGSACSGGIALLSYIINETKGYELFRNNLCGLNSKEIIEEMNIIQDFNQRAKNKTLSLVLSPSIEDGKKLSDFELKEITIEFMKELGIDPDNHLFLAFVHIEKLHKHVHVYCGRLNMETGKMVNDHYLGKRSQWIAHRIALRRNLISAKQLMINKIKSADVKDLKATKKEIYEKHQKAISMQLDSLDSYFDVMKSMGVIVQPSINKQGQIQGHRFLNVATNENFKASEINRRIDLKNFGNNKILEEETKKIKAPKFRR